MTPVYYIIGFCLLELIFSFIWDARIAFRIKKLKVKLDEARRAKIREFKLARRAMFWKADSEEKFHRDRMDKWVAIEDQLELEIMRLETKPTFFS